MALGGIDFASETLVDFGSQRRTASERAVAVLRASIFYGVLVIIGFTAIPYGTVHPQWQAVFECGVFALTGLWLIESYLSGTLRLSGGLLLAPLVALLAFAHIQTLVTWPDLVGGISLRHAVSADIYETRLFATKLLALILTLGLLMRFTSNRRRLCALIYIVIGIAVASAVFGLVRQTAQRQEGSFILSYLIPGRGYGQFINRNHFALLMEMSLGLVLGLVAGGGVSRNRLPFYFAAIITLWTTLVLSNSRGGIFSMLCQLIFVALFFSVIRQHGDQHRRKDRGKLERLTSKFAVRLALGVSLVIAVVLGSVWVGGDSLVSRLENVSGEISEEEVDSRLGERRLNIWRATWQLIQDHPIAGVGFGAYATVIPKYHDAAGEIVPQQAHNDYLELLASGGLIGLVLFGWFVITFIWHVRKRLQSADAFRRAACLGALTGIFGVAVHSLLDFGLHITVNALIFVALVVIATVKASSSRANEIKPANVVEQHSRMSLDAGLR